MSYDAPPPPPPGGYPPPPPGAGYGGPPGPMPDNYLVWAILTTIFCCLPLGVVSIVYSTQVSSKYYAGDYAGALTSSRSAKQWAVWSAVAYAGLAVVGVLFVLVVTVAAGS